MQIAAVVVMCGVPANPICAGIVTGIVVGITSGNLGLALRSGLIAAVTAAAFYQVGELTTGLPGAPNGGHAALDFMSEAHIFNMAGHAAVGCGSAVASGGSCGAGALSAGAGSFASPLMKGWGFTAKLVATSVIGGVASVAGGGKFGNGAMTAAFGYLFNEMGDYAQRGYETEQPSFQRALQCVGSCTMEQFGVQTLFGAGGVVAGLPLLDKPFVTPGSSEGTSLASKYLLEWIPEEWRFMDQRRWAPTWERPFAQTRLRALYIARWTPWIGGAVLTYDAAKISYCTYQCMKK